MSKKIEAMTDDELLFAMAKERGYTDITKSDWQTMAFGMTEEDRHIAEVTGHEGVSPIPNWVTNEKDALFIAGEEEFHSDWIFNGLEIGSEYCQNERGEQSSMWVAAFYNQSDGVELTATHANPARAISEAWLKTRWYKRNVTWEEQDES